MSNSLRTWLWQLSYALLGLGFLFSVFLGAMAWGTPTFWTFVTIGSWCIVALFLLNRSLNSPRPPSNARQ